MAVHVKKRRKKEKRKKKNSKYFAAFSMRLALVIEIFAFSPLEVPSAQTPPRAKCGTPAPPPTTIRLREVQTCCPRCSVEDFAASARGLRDSKASYTTSGAMKEWRQPAPASRIAEAGTGLHEERHRGRDGGRGGDGGWGRGEKGS